MEFRFRCSCCEEEHRGIPTFGATAPLFSHSIPEADREQRCSLGPDDCVIDDEHFFIRGCVEIPVHGHDEPFIWGVWVSLSRESFTDWRTLYDNDDRSTRGGPYFGWLDTWLEPYPSTVNLKTRAHLRDDGVRPYIELEPTDHPLAVEQREGISESRLQEIYETMMHLDERNGD